MEEGGAISSSQTWHYGLVARWWAEFNHDGPEIEYFRSFVERGEPALDVGCGTGRLLIPYIRAGLDVDGCDVSGDMIDLCRTNAERAGVSPRLFVQPMHELRPPRLYRTIFVCGAFGLGSTREQDVQALRRFRDHLEPGGSLVFDVEVPYSAGYPWMCWTAHGRSELPREWKPVGETERRTGSDRAEYALQSRIVDLDPLEQRAAYEIRAEMWRDGLLIREEEHSLHINFYFKNELLLLLDRAGFSDVEVYGGYSDRAPAPSDDFLVFAAHKPQAPGNRRHE